MVQKHPIALHGNFRDLTGHRSGRLLAMRPIGRSADGHVLWECRCDCGTVREVKSHSLVRGTGRTRSCGCLRREVSSRPKQAWNKGLTYSLAEPCGAEREYRHKHSWARAARRIKGDRCEICGWTAGRCDAHHKISRGRGGRHTISNALVVCPNCHRLIHEGKTLYEIPQPVQRNRGGNRRMATARVERGRIRRD